MMNQGIMGIRSRRAENQNTDSNGATIFVPGGNNQNRGNDVPEDSRRENKIVGIYNRLFGRSPNLENLSYWIESGVPIENLESAIRAGAQGSDVGLLGLEGSATGGRVPNWLQAPPDDMSTAQVMTEYTNPATGETFLAPNSGYRINRDVVLNDFYNNMFGRDVGDVGREYYLRGEGTNVATDQLGAALAAGAQGTDATVNAVRQIYMDELGRDPIQTGDLSGLEYWTGVDVDKENDPGTTSLTDLDQIRLAIRNSTESLLNDPMAQQVTDIYQDVLGRDPDLQGLEYWTGLDVDKESDPGTTSLTDIDAIEAAIRASEEAQGLGEVDTGEVDTGEVDTGGTGTEMDGGLASLQSQLDALQGNYDSLLSQYEELRALLDSGTGTGTGTGTSPGTIYPAPFGETTGYTGVSITPYSSTPGGFSGPGGVMRPTIQQTPYTQLPQLQGGPSLGGSASYLRPFGTSGTPEDSFLSDPFSPASNVGYMPPPVYFPFAYQSG